MKYYKGFAIPEHEESDDIAECCVSSKSEDCTNGCSKCLLSHVVNDDKKWEDNSRLFQQWLAAGRPIDREE